jgi:hypothetical protein
MDYFSEAGLDVVLGALEAEIREISGMVLMKGYHA